MFMSPHTQSATGFWGTFPWTVTRGSWLGPSCVSALLTGWGRAWRVIRVSMFQHRSDTHHFPVEVLARSRFPGETGKCSPPVHPREENKIEHSEFIILSLPQRSSRARTEKCLLDGATKLSLYPKHLTIISPQKRYLLRSLSTYCMFKRACLILK